MPPIPIRVTSVKVAEGDFLIPWLAITHFGWDDGLGETGVITRDRMHEFLTDGGKAYIRNEEEEIVFVVADYYGDTKIVKPEYRGMRYESLLLELMKVPAK